MNEVLNKVQELVALLEEKNKVTAVLNKQLTEQKKNNETLNEQAIAKLKHASAMERVYKK
ncbi:MAG: hypothetical protein GY861_19270, partial [bacterium]|nr:hypothetical protein [bacterium]